MVQKPAVQNSTSTPAFIPADSEVMASYRKSVPPRIVYTLSIFPMTITIGSSTIITAIADVGDGDVGSGSTIIPDSVELLRYSGNDKLMVNYGRMYDDGTHGDLKSNDGKYTTQISIQDTILQQTYFTASVSYSGMSEKVFAQPVHRSTVSVVASPEAVLQTVAEALERNDMKTVRIYIYMSNRNIEILKMFDTSQEYRLGAADIFRHAKLKNNDGGIATFDSDGDPIKLARDKDGWKLVAW